MSKKRLVIISNRLPVSVEIKDEIQYHQSMGGLATGLSSFYQNYNCVWVGWSGLTDEEVNPEQRKEITRQLKQEYQCHPLFLPEKHLNNYYYGFCNESIWPLFHYFNQYAIFKKEYWESYYQVNKFFSEKLTKILDTGDILWIHDYHLFLLPGMIRKKFPDLAIGYFLHIPFPSFEIFRLLPWRKELLEGVICSDLIGFHTYDYVRHFLSSVRRILGYEHTLGKLKVKNHVALVDIFPMGIEYSKFATAVRKKEIKKEIKKIKDNLPKKKIILSIDRMDYTKGIEQRLKSYEIFLEKFPKYHQQVTLILVAVPSRTEVEQYQELKKVIEVLVAEINGKYGGISWTPIIFIYRAFLFEELAALYNIADVCLVTPIRDGMNLIAKEYIASKGNQPGVLILSEMAGAVEEMGEVLVINPNDFDQIAQAIDQALSMPEQEQKERNAVVRDRLKRYDIIKWATDFIDSLFLIKKYQNDLKEKKLSRKYQKKIIEEYIKSQNSLFLLDYDGTLREFHKKPSKAVPSEKLLKILNDLSEKSRVVIISGRNAKTLDQWFKSVRNLDLIAEHGVWIKKSGCSWETVEPLSPEWKDQIKPVLEYFVDRTPGSFIEEKDYSLVWHFRGIDPALATVRSNELKETLFCMIGNLDIGILEGNKVIEIKNSGINKGRGALYFINEQDWDFIFAAGDDVTDEDIFQVLPENAWSIKVGSGFSNAKYTLNSVEEVVVLLEKMGGKN
ncbi:MAG: trehalose-6-phosphate synthase [Desulfuromonas sp. SDB]|nr:MAG: trehalose-6-phosphate synthase [Desulfuromonas sp. SDB]